MRWVLKKNDNILFRAGSWQECLAEAVTRGLVVLTSAKSFRLEPWCDITTETE